MAVLSRSGSGTNAALNPGMRALAAARSPTRAAFVQTPVASAEDVLVQEVAVGPEPEDQGIQDRPEHAAF